MPRSTVATLLLTYVVAVCACRWLVFGAIALDGPTIVAMVAVPLVQALAIAGWRRVVGRRPRP
jgi:hypothetical protein